jgi:hypothetical protein
MSPTKKNVKPSKDFLLVATTGAVLIVTKRSGWVALTPDAMREVVAHGNEYADLAEIARADKMRSFTAGRTRQQ